MFLKVGAYTRPFNEATASISYVPEYDARNRMIAVQENWGISGRIVLQTNATERRMTRAIEILQRDFNQFRPDLIFLEDDGITESALKIKAADCVEGPRVINSSFPDDGANIYATGVQYGADFTAKRMVVGGSNIITEFQETVTNPSGGEVHGYVGGAINLPERQRFKQHEPFRYTQSGRAVGMFGYPFVPNALWPQFQLKRMVPTKIGPRENAPVPKYFEIQWEYEFASHVELFGNPHVLV